MRKRMGAIGPEIVDGVEGRRVVRAQGLLLLDQLSLVHPLRLSQLALVMVQI
jgi:hypothetical protein